MAATETDQVEFGILGTLEVRVAGVPITMRQGLTRSVLLALLLRPNQTVSTDVLIEDLYGEELPAHPLNALQVQVSYLRKVLSDVGMEDMLRTEGTGYRLVVERTAVDSGQFEFFIDRARRLADEAGPDDLAEALQYVDEALALWRGSPLEDVAYRDFAAGEIARLAELRLSARELRAELHLALGHHREIVPDLTALSEEHPLRERAHELLMVALYRAGRQADALREYETTRRTLGDELGLAPGAELRRLERAILDQDPLLDWAPHPSRRRSVSVAGANVVAAAPLPAPIAGLVGRVDDLVAIGDLLTRSRAVTLTGPGGSGKTRLAIEYALKSPVDRWFVDLGPVSDGAAVFNEIATAFGATIRGGDEELSGVSALSPTGLLILDTCEHVVESAAEAVAGLLHQCPDLRVLATSRRPLEVVGELVWSVAPLPLPADGSVDDRTEIGASPAVQLFLERANASRPGFELTDENAGAVAAICRALDGLPLGIELAAARLDVLSPAEVHHRLDDRFTLLNSGSRGATARQRNLRAALDWSYELLAGEERLMFQRLAVLPGAFSIDLACAMVDGAVVSDAVDLLRSLVRQSMLTRHGAEQFAILDTLQAYARERADRMETAEAMQALTLWAADVAEERDRAVRSSTQLEALAAFRRDLPNLRAALQWSLAEDGDPDAGAALAGRLGWFWHLTGMYEEGHRWTLLATAVSGLNPSVRVLASIGAGLHATALGHLREARAFLDDAVVAASELPSPGLELRARVHRGDMEWWFDDIDAAESDLSAAASGDHDPNDTELWVQAFAQLHLGRLRLRQLRYDDANSLFEEAHTLLDPLGDAYLLELELRFRARGASLEGNPAGAVVLASRALEYAETLGHTEGIAISLLALGEAKRELGALEEAAAVLRRAVEFSVAGDHIGSVCQALALLAAIDADSGKQDATRKLLQRLLSAQATAGLPILTPGGVVQRLVADLLEGRYPKATDRPDVSPAQGRADLRRLALEYLG